MANPTRVAVLGHGLAAPLFGACLLLLAPAARAQDNYEIQVYGSDTVAPKTLMVELHSNFTVEGFQPLPGSPFQLNGTFPTNHAEHETVELTEASPPGPRSASTSSPASATAKASSGSATTFAPASAPPARWHLPVGLSLSNEIGYQRARFSPDTWTWEIRPIIDKQAGRWYLAFNPALDRSWHGPGVHQGLTFSPNVKAGYDFTKKINAGLEYYAAYGDIRGFDTLHDQQQQFFVATDLNVSPKWEFNFGIGVGTTASTDHLILKTIVGRRFNWGHNNEETPDTSKGDVRQDNKPKP